MSLKEVVHAFFYTHQTVTCAGMCACNHTHQMDKTDIYLNIKKRRFVYPPFLFDNFQ